VTQIEESELGDHNIVFRGMKVQNPNLHMLITYQGTPGNTGSHLRLRY
jgi:hypothetical protein